MIKLNTPPVPVESIDTTDNGGTKINWSVLSNGHLRLISEKFTYGAHIFVNAEDLDTFIEGLQNMRDSATRKPF